MSRGAPASFTTPRSNLISSLRQNANAAQTQAIRRQLGPAARARFASTASQSIQVPAPVSAPPAPSNVSVPQAPVINGIALNLRTSPTLQFHKQLIAKMCDKSARDLMPADVINDISSPSNRQTTRGEIQ